MATSFLGSLMSMAARSSSLLPSSSLVNPLWTSVRLYRYHADKMAKGKVLRRHGYEDKIFLGGPLPREVFPDKPILQMPEYKPKNAWNEKRALFGQNDYIDILGPIDPITTKPIHPTKLLYNLPPWLRGVNGNEYQNLLRKRKFLQNKSAKVATPERWATITRRIQKLYKYLNRKTKSPFWKDA
nr:EOG090X0JAK [Eubosmina coregoni]